MVLGLGNMVGTAESFLAGKPASSLSALLLHQAGTYHLGILKKILFIGFSVKSSRNWQNHY